METFEKIFNPVTFLAVNLIIIISVLATGEFFLDSGLIHVFAILFIVLSAARIFFHYYTYDQFLEKFFHAGVVAFIIFAMSHFVEFLSYRVLGLSEDVTFANVANFYIIGLLIFTIGAELFLKAHDRRGAWFVWVLSIVAISFVIPMSVFFLRPDPISLEPEAPAPYVYSALAVAAAALAFWKIERIGRLVSISRKFSYYLLPAIALVTFSILVNGLYELFEKAGLESYQVVYLAHFLFYAAMSLMFLGFRTMSHLGGVYEELKKVNNPSFNLNS